MVLIQVIAYAQPQSIEGCRLVSIAGDEDRYQFALELMQVLEQLQAI